MQDTTPESRKQRLHEEWLSRGAYDECFGSREAPVAFKKWRGNADRCRCGCEGVRYSRSNPHNLWASLSPQLLWEEKFLLPQFRDLRDLLWALPGIAWTAFRLVFCLTVFRDTVIANPLENKLGRALTPLRFLFWSAISVFLFMAVVAAWLMSRFTVIVLSPFYVVAMVLFTTSILLSGTLAALLMASYSLVFLLGGAASILYLSSPAIGISLIVAGVGLEYERGRRRDRQNREQLGQVLRIIDRQPDSDLPAGK